VLYKDTRPKHSAYGPRAIPEAQLLSYDNLIAESIKLTLTALRLSGVQDTMTRDKTKENHCGNCKKERAA